MSAPSFFSSLRFRLTLWYSGLLALFLVVFASATYTVVVRVLVEQQVTLERQTVQFDITDTAGGRLTIELPRQALEDRALHYGCPPGVTRPDPRCGPLPASIRNALRNRLRQSQLGQQQLPAQLPPATYDGQYPPARLDAPDARPPIISSEDLYWADADDEVEPQQPYTPSVQRTDVVRVGFEEESRDLVRRSLFRFMLWMTPLLLAISALGGYWIARRALQPISTITATAQRIRSGNLRERINLRGSHQEVQQLADTLDDMLAELERLFEHEKRFASDASHELQTPLAVIRTSAEVAMTDPDITPDARESFSSVIESTDRISRIVDDLLLLATLEQHTAPRTTVELRPLISGVLKHLEPLAEAKGLRLELLAGAELRVRTAADRIERAVANLVENAIKYSERGAVTVELLAGRDGVRIAIRDTGPGIAAQHLPHLFERFYRVDKGRSRAAGGTGLGLAIVHAAVTSLGGRIEVQSEVGTGSTFTITLPASPPVRR